MTAPSSRSRRLWAAGAGLALACSGSTMFTPKGGVGTLQLTNNTAFTMRPLVSRYPSGVSDDTTPVGASAAACVAIHADTEYQVTLIVDTGATARDTLTPVFFHPTTAVPNIALTVFDSVGIRQRADSAAGGCALP